MQGQTVYAGPSSQQQASKNRVGRWIYLLLPAFVVVLVGGSMFWLQWASQRGITLGYPMPTVHIISAPSNPLLIHSSATFSANATGRDVTYTWDFGDGTTAVGSTVDHTYQSNGSFTVTVKATDAINQTGSDRTTVQVLPPPPTASFTYSFGYYYGQVYFDASGSTADASTSISSYSWNFGDGNSDTSYSSQEEHQYAYTGTYQVSLVVTDATGQASSAYTVSVVISG